MPTTRPRHTVTETPDVQAALDELRAKMGERRIDFGELMILGARAKAREMSNDEAEAQTARRELSKWIRDGDGPKLDIAAADEVKRLGLIRLEDLA
jgi:hypothetical protein